MSRDVSAEWSGEALDHALASVRQLTAENERLRQRIKHLENQPVSNLHQDAASLLSREQDASDVSNASPADLKIELFRSLFRGRDDVFATRWENGDGRSGYSPALRRGVPRGRGVKHAAEDYIPLTDMVIRHHLEGVETVGVYPLLRDETCSFLAIDFDKEGWKQDASAVLEACDSLGVPASLERSRSGQGCHLWIFFSTPVAASLARNLGSAMLTNALDRRHQISLDTYDRLFPSQDTLPGGGFGNLIALPLQGESRRAGNTLFLNREFEPDVDQWRLLALARKMTPAEAELIVREATREKRLLAVGDTWPDESAAESRPWGLPPSRRLPETPIAGPLPSKVMVVLANRVFIEKRDLPASLIGHLRRLAAFQNPEFYRAQSMRLSTFGKPRFIDCSEDFADHLALPRGCWSAVSGLLKANAISADFQDERAEGDPIQIAFQGELTDEQMEAAEGLIKHEMGVLSAPTAFGKTVIGAWLIAQRQVSTLVLVHRQHLLDQWRERLASFLDIPVASIGQIGGGKRSITSFVDVGLLQSVVRNGAVNDLVANYGQVIVDECHHVPAFSFERVLAEVRARFVVGLTATPQRKDGHHPIIAMQCGSIRYRVDAKKQAAAQPFEHEVLVRVTDFSSTSDATAIQEIYSQLAADEARTELVVGDVLHAVHSGRSPLVLTERIDHLEQLARLLEGKVPHVLVLRGGTGVRQRRQIAEALQEISDQEPRVLLATGRYIGEGFDDARLDTLFLTMPISWRGTIQQYAGRLHRLHADKRLVQIYDYADLNVAMLGRMLKRRLNGYRDIGYSVRLGS